MTSVLEQLENSSDLEITKDFVRHTLELSDGTHYLENWPTVQRSVLADLLPEICTAYYGASQEHNQLVDILLISHTWLISHIPRIVRRALYIQRANSPCPCTSTLKGVRIHTRAVQVAR